MRLTTVSLICLLLFGLAACAPAPEETATVENDEYVVYIGTYTRETSEGIYMCRFDASTGELTPVELAAKTTDPSFLTIHPDRQYLYAVNETKDGSVTAFSIDSETAKLTELNSASAHGDLPCHLKVDDTGANLAVANYSTGNVILYPLDPERTLGEASNVIQHEGEGFRPRQQPGPLAHSTDFSPDNRFLLTCDKGLDRIYVYRFDPAESALVPNDPPFAEVEPGSGPRHFAFHPNGRFGFAINELGSTVTAFAYDAEQGALRTMQTISTLPEGYEDRNYTAEIAVHPSGRFLYGSNRGHDSIAVYSVNPDTGALELVEITPSGGQTPRSFAIDPTGAYLFAANQQSDNVVVFEIDAQTGRLTDTGKSFTVDAPVCIQFLKP